MRDLIYFEQQVKTIGMLQLARDVTGSFVLNAI